MITRSFWLFSQLTAHVLEQCLLLVPVSEVDQCVLMKPVGGRNYRDIFVWRHFRVQSRTYCLVLTSSLFASWRVAFYSEELAAYTCDKNNHYSTLVTSNVASLAWDAELKHFSESCNKQKFASLIARPISGNLFRTYFVIGVGRILRHWHGSKLKTIWDSDTLRIFTSTLYGKTKTTLTDTGGAVLTLMLWYRRRNYKLKRKKKTAILQPKNTKLR